MAFNIVKKLQLVVLGGGGGMTVRCFGASKQKTLLDKAKVGRYRIINPSSTKEAGYRFDSSNALKEYLKPQNPGVQDGRYCAICGNLKGQEEDCTFLSPHEPACPAKAKMSKAQVNKILKKQKRDGKNE